MITTAPEQLLEQKAIIDRYLKESRDNLSAFSFVNVFAWQEFFDFDLKFINGCLCIFAQGPAGRFLYLPPLGRHIDAEVIDRCFALMEEVNQGNGVTRVECVDAKHLKYFSPERYSYFEKGYEYCYLRNNIASMQGNRFKTKRSSYNQFVKNYRYRYRPYDASMAAECCALYRQWAIDRRAKCAEDIYSQMLTENEKVHELVMNHYQALGLTGRVVTINDEIKAYSFGYSINDAMFCVLFEIAALDINGLSTFIFTEFCRDEALQEHTFVNVMDDFGMDNIRQTKLSFRPDVLLQSYAVTKRRSVIF